MLNNFAWLLVILCIYAKICIIKKKILGFWLWSISDILWACHNFYIGENAQAVSMLIYLLFSIYGIWNWNNNKGEGEYDNKK